MTPSLQRLRAWSNKRLKRLAERSVVRYWDWRADTHASQPGQRNYPELWRAVFAQSFPAQPGPLELLDVGTGTGFCALPLARMGHRLTAVDISSAMLSGTRDLSLSEELRIRFMQADATAPQLTPESFDGVVARNLLWTLPRPEEALRRWHELLRPGGRLLISDGLWNPPALSVRRALSGLAPGSRDRSGLRFEASYLWARGRLPLYSGLDASRARLLLEDAGFEDPKRLDGAFEADPFDMPGSGFFILTARKPSSRARDKDLP